MTPGLVGRVATWGSLQADDYPVFMLLWSASALANEVVTIANGETAG